MPLSPRAIRAIREQLTEAASEPLVPTAVIEAAVERIARREGRESHNDSIAHPSHAAWLEQLCEHRLEVQANNLAEALARACFHLPQLPLPRPGAISEISAVETLGSETHNHGKQPVLMRFSPEQAVVYKPVSLQTDHLVSSLLAEVSPARRSEALFATLRYAPLGDEYGFVAYTSTAQYSYTKAALGRFYFRFGSLVAAAYALNITDLHMENVLAVGAYPVAIDFETAFYRFPDVISPPDVTSSGLIERPGPTAANSGLQGGGSCRRWALHPRDERGRQVVGYRRPHFHAANRRSDLSGQLVEPSRFLPELLAGFELGYRVMMREQDRLRGNIEASLQAGDLRVRHIIRFTAHYVVRYFQLLQPTPTPTKERERALRISLENHRSSVDEPSARLIESEVSDLLRGDVPYFWTQLDSCDLRDRRGVAQPRCFRSSPLETLEQQLRRLSETDLRDQRLLLEESLAPSRLHAQLPSRGRVDEKPQLEGSAE